jgi:DNA-binding transcriptional LysR family regulator
MLVIQIMRTDHVSRVDLNLLPALDALLQEGSVTGAARRLRLTQSATSRALARLREVFEDPLFVRSGRGLTPTRLARQLAGPVRKNLAELETLLAEKGTFDPRVARRRFILAGIDYPQVVVLAPLARRLASHAPNITLEIRHVSASADRELETGELDLLLSPRQPSGAGVVWTRLFDDRYVCLVADDHPARRLTLARYLELPHVFVAPRERPGGPVEDALAKRGLHRTVALQVPSFSLVPDVLLGTRYIATVPERIAHVLCRRFSLRQLPAPIDVEGFAMCQAWHEAHRNDEGHRWLRDQCARAAGAFVDGSAGP